MKEPELKDIDFIKIYTKTKTFFKSHLTLLILFTLSGGIISAANFYLTNNYYTTDFVITNGSMVEVKTIKDIIDNSKNGYITSANLNLNQEKINVIAQDFLNVKKLNVDTSTPNKLLFKLKINDNEADLNSLKNSIVSLLFNNTYLAELTKTKKEQLEDEFVSINTEIGIIDSLQKIMLSNSKMMMINFTDFSKSVYHLKKQKIILKKELNSLNEYNIIRDIYKPQTPERTLRSAILFGVILGFFSGIIFGVIRQLNRLSKEHLT